jgi:hypothetical protein
MEALNVKKRVCIIALLCLLLLSVLCMNGCTGVKKTVSSTASKNTVSVNESGMVASTISSATQTSSIAAVSNKVSSTKSQVTSSSKTSLTEKFQDLKGARIKIASIWAAGWLGAAKASKDDNPAIVAAQKKFKDNLAQIQKDYNCRIDLFAANETKILGDIVAAMSAGDRYADIIEIAPLQYYTLVTNKSQLLIPIESNKYIDLKNAMWFKPSSEFTQYRGKTYGISWISEITGTPVRQCMFFNKNVLKKYGQPDLYDLVKKKEWTWDKFHTIIQDIYNKSGKTVSGVTAFGPETLAELYAFSNKGGFAQQANNKFSYIGNSDNTLEALDTVQKLLAEKGSWLQPKAGDWTKGLLLDFEQGRVAFSCMDYNVAPNYLFTGMKDDYGIVPVPIGPKETAYKGYYNEGRFFCFLKGKTADYDNASLILNAIVSRTAVADWKTMEKGMGLRDNESADTLETLLNNPVIDITPSCLAFRDQVLPTVTNIIKGSTSPKSGMQSIQKQAQTALDNVFNK